MRSCHLTLKFLIRTSKIIDKPAANVCKKGGQGQANRFTSWHANSSSTTECDLRFSPDIKRQTMKHAYAAAITCPWRLNLIQNFGATTTLYKELNALITFYHTPPSNLWFLEPSDVNIIKLHASMR